MRPKSSTIKVVFYSTIFILVIAGIFIFKFRPDWLFKAIVDDRGANPKLYWNLDDSTGTTINDKSGNTKTGTAANITWRNGDYCKVGPCVYFNGTSSLISRTYSSDTLLNPGTATFSVTAWIRHPTAISGTQYIVSRYNAAGYKIYMKNTGVLCFGIDDDASFTPGDEPCSTTTYNDNKWHFIEAVRNSTDVKLYVDNILVGSDTSLLETGSLSGTTPTFYVGVNSDGTTLFWNGFIDEVKFYAYARDTYQRMADMSARGTVLGQSAGSSVAPLVTDNLVAYWPMDETAANTCTGGVNDSCDASGNANDGAWTGNATTSFTSDVNSKYGHGTTYDGTGDYIQVANSTSISPTSAISLSGWFDIRTSAVSKALMVKNLAYRMVTDASGHAVCQISDGSTWQTAATSTAVLSLSVKYHLVCTYDRSTVTVYVNGAVSGTSAVTVAIGSNANPLRIGNDASATFGDVNARIDDVRVFNVAIPPAQVYALYTWAPPPVGYWKFDEATGTTANDMSGTGNTGTLTSGPTWAQGIFGQSVVFDASNDYVAVGSSNTLSQANNMSVSAWIYPTSYGKGNAVGAIVYHINGAAGYELETINNGTNVGTLCFYDGTTTYCAANSSIVLNKWQHVAYIINNNSIRLYINGVNVTDSVGGKSGTINLINAGSTATSIGGHSGTTDVFGGSIDEVRIYNYSRTQAQVMEDMNAGKPAGTVSSNSIPAGTTLGYWKMDEGSSTVANSTSPGSNMYGTLTNMASPATTTSGWTNSGKNGKAVVFDGSNDYIDVGSNSTTKQTQDITLSAWINLVNVSSSHTVLAKEGASGNFSYELYTDTNGKLNFDVSSDGTAKTVVTGGTTLSTGTWYHVVGVYTPGTSLQVYVNSSIDGTNTTSIPSAIFDGTGSFQIGAANAGTLMQGTIDEAKLYGAALTSSQVAVDMNYGKNQILGNLSTGSDGSTGSLSNDREYCIPGDTTSCSAPVNEWKLDDNTGTVAYDTAGMGRDLTFGATTTAPSWTRGKTGSGLLFNSANQTYTDGGTTNMIGNSTAFTISIWAKTTSTSKGKIITERSAGVPFVYISINENATNDVEFGIQDDSSTWGGNSFTSVGSNNGAWHHYEFVQHSKAFRAFYMDGVLLGLETTSLGTLTLNQFRVGANGQTVDNFNGSIDNIRIYNYARSPDQVRWDYAKGAPMGSWRLDDCTGGTAHDSSGNGNDGTITIGAGGAQTATGTCTSSATDAWFNGAVGRFGSSLSFDGTDDIVSIPDDTSLYPSAVDGLTMIAWFKTPTSTVSFISKNGASGNDVYDFGLSFGFLGAVAKDSSYSGANNFLSIAQSLNDDKWHFGAYTYNRITGLSSLYVDGILDNSQTESPNPSGAIGSTGNVYFGGQDGTANFAGQLDNVKMYNYALTPIQIKMEYNEGAAIRIGP